jgi:hypothetical protein
MTYGDCTVASSATCFRSPNYPSNYGIDQLCVITAREQVTLSVTAGEFNLEENPTCDWDYLGVDGTKYCGATGPEGVQVSAGSNITFTSDASVTFAGFEICGASPPGEATNPESGRPSLRLFGRSPPSHPMRATRTTLSLIPTVNGNTVRSFPTHGQQSAAKGSSTTVSRSDIRSIQHLDSSAHGFVRRWRLIGYFPIHSSPHAC